MHINSNQEPMEPPLTILSQGENIYVGRVRYLDSIQELPSHTTHSSCRLLRGSNAHRIASFAPTRGPVFNSLRDEDKIPTAAQVSSKLSQKLLPLVVERMPHVKSQ